MPLPKLLAGANNEYPATGAFAITPDDNADLVRAFQ